MKTQTIFFWIFLFGVYTFARTMTVTEEGVRINARFQETQNPSFTWKTPFALHVVYPNGEDDYINLEPVQMSGAPVKCLFRGRFYRDKSSTAVIAGCMEDDKVSITIVAKELWGRTAFEVNNGFLEEVENPYAGDLDEEYDEDDYDYEDDDLGNRVKRSVYEDYQDYNYTDEQYQYDGIANSVDPPPPLLTTPLKLAFDRSLRDKMGSEEAAKTYVRSVAELGSVYLENFSPTTKIFLNFVDEIEFFDETLEPNVFSLHRAFELKTREKVPMVIFTSKEDNNVQMGISPGLPGKACYDDKGVSIVKERSMKSLAALTFSHELGHIHGMKHDWKENASCANNGLMSVVGPELSLSQRPTTFSWCSIARFSKWYGRFGIKCMKMGIVNKDSKLKYLETKVEHLENKLEHLEDKCSSLITPPGAPLKSGCQKPEQLQNGAWICSEDGISCYTRCNKGFKPNKKPIIVCDHSNWNQTPNNILCIPIPKHLDEVALIVGGGSNNKVELWSPSGKCNRQLKDLPVDGYGVTTNYINVDGGLILSCGYRYDKKNWHNKCFYLDVETEEWKFHSTLLRSYRLHSSFVMNGTTLYLVGGSVRGSTIEYLVPGTTIWRQASTGNLGIERYGTCSLQTSSNTFVVTAGSYLGKPKTGEEYNVITKKWRSFGNEAEAKRCYHGCALIHTQNVYGILIAGGTKTGAFEARTTSYFLDLSENNPAWKKSSNMKFDHEDGRMVKLNNRYFMLGGERSTKVEEYNPQYGAWTSGLPDVLFRRNQMYGVTAVPSCLFQNCNKM